MDKKFSLEELKVIVENLKKQIVIRKLDQITIDECLIVYQPIQENAVNHFAIADLLANNKQYGSAITHSILGAEEMTKAVIIFLNGNKINLQSIRGYKGLIQSHLPRHTFANIIGMMATMIEPMLTIFKHFKMAHSDSEGLVKSALDNYDHKLEKDINDLDFWFKADIMKNKGLYVDFKNQIMKPQDLTKDDFDSTIKSCLKHYNLCTNIISTVQNTTPEVLKFWQQKSNTKEFKDIVSLFFKQ